MSSSEADEVVDQRFQALERECVEADAKFGAALLRALASQKEAPAKKKKKQNKGKAKRSHRLPEGSPPCC